MARILMSALLASLASVFLIIAAGCAARQAKFLDDAAWRGFEAVTYHLLFPAVVIHTLAFSPMIDLSTLGLAGALVVGLGIATAVLFALRTGMERAGIDGPAFTSVLQGGVRWNTFVALALASHQFGAAGVALMAIAIAALIPVVNIICVSALARHAQGKTLSLPALASTLIRNPFIWSCCVGLALNPVAGFIPGPAASAIDIIGRASLAAGLLVVGAGLDLKSLARPRLAHLIAIGVKLALFPAAVYLAARVFGLEGAPLAVAMIAASVPTASASYILARQMGGDAPLMAEIATLQTLLAMATMPVILLVAL